MRSPIIAYGFSYRIPIGLNCWSVKTSVKGGEEIAEQRSPAVLLGDNPALKARSPAFIAGIEPYDCCGNNSVGRTRGLYRRAGMPVPFTQRL